MRLPNSLTAYNLSASQPTTYSLTTTARYLFQSIRPWSVPDSTRPCEGRRSGSIPGEDA